MLTFGYQLDPIFRMTKLYELEQKHIKDGLLKIADDVILEKQKKFATDGGNHEHSDGSPQTFIDQLFKMRDAFSIEEMRDEINTIILAVSISHLFLRSTSFMALNHCRGLKLSQAHFPS
jgi:hypothetical protein